MRSAAPPYFTPASSPVAYAHQLNPAHVAARRAKRRKSGERMNSVAARFSDPEIPKGN